MVAAMTWETTALLLSGRWKRSRSDWLVILADITPLQHIVLVARSHPVFPVHRIEILRRGAAPDWYNT